MKTKEQLQQSQASTWQPNITMEKLITLQKSDPAAFAKIPATTRLQLGNYIAGKSAVNDLYAGQVRRIPGS